MYSAMDFDVSFQSLYGVSPVSMLPATICTSLAITLATSRWLSGVPGKEGQVLLVCLLLLGVRGLTNFAGAICAKSVGNVQRLSNLASKQTKTFSLATHGIQLPKHSYLYSVCSCILISVMFLWCRSNWATPVEQLPWWITVPIFCGTSVASEHLVKVRSIATSATFELSRCTINAVIEQIKAAGPPPQKKDWDALSSEVNKKDEELEDVWKFMGMGHVFILAYSCETFGIFVCAALVIASTGSADIYFYIGTFAFMFCGCLLARRLSAMASITSMCMNTKASADSIPAAARRYPRLLGRAGAAMSEDEKHAHQRFLTYVGGNKMGVELCGVLVTPEFVMNTTVKLLVQVPALYGILTAVLKK